MLAAEGTTAFGAASLTFLRFTRGPLGAGLLLAGSLLLWMIVPPLLAARWLGRSVDPRRGCHGGSRLAHPPAPGRSEQEDSAADWHRHRGVPRPTLGQVLSFTVSDVPLLFTEAMPLSRAASEVYISLVPITWWLAAFNVK